MTKTSGKFLRYTMPSVEPEERKRIGERITRARRESGLTQRDLADQLGITTRSVQNYESGAIVPWRHLGPGDTSAASRC